jgi:Glycosyl transferase family 2/Glycosyltransferase sugar-binding region containing DXD motif
MTDPLDNSSIPKIIPLDNSSIPKIISLDNSSIPKIIPLDNSSIPKIISLDNSSIPKIIPLDNSSIPKIISLDNSSIPKIISLDNSSIPKIIHQIWIGPKPCPINLTKTWEEKHPNFEYILWTEAELENRKIHFECIDQINIIPEINGKADIIRWELLWQFGGYFVDADSICIEPFDQFFEGRTAFATYENENNREGLIATGTMGFRPKHPLCRDIIEWIKKEENQTTIKETRAWYSVGPALLTKFLDTGKYPDFTVYPSYCFLPIHFTGIEYMGHKKVYGFQEWGTAKQSYDTMNSVILPQNLKEPPKENWVSVLITNYNTDPKYIKECLDSIRAQEGYFGIELVWVEDGSKQENQEAVKQLLKKLYDTSRFIKIKPIFMTENRGHARALNRGLPECSHHLIFKMDADDIMMPTRIQIQKDFMDSHKEVMILGSNMTMFTNTARKKTIIGSTNHPIFLSQGEFKQNPPNWFMNHPTICYRKQAIWDCLKGYSVDPYIIENIHEDYDMEVRFLKEYGNIYNLQENLLYYRIHESQITSRRILTPSENIEIKTYIIKKHL